MDRMSPLDAAFLEAEDEDLHTSMACAATGIFEGAAPTQDVIFGLAADVRFATRRLMPAS